MENIRLQDAVSASIGLPTSGRTPIGQGSHDVCILNVRNVTPAGIFGPFDRSHVHDHADVARYEARPGDVVLTTRGSRFSPGLIMEEHSGLIPSSNIVLLRPDGYDGHVLYAYLASPAGQNALEALSRGSTIRSISLSDLGTLPLPRLSLADGGALGRLVQSMLTAYAAATAAAEHRLTTTQNIINQRFQEITE